MTMQTYAVAAWARQRGALGVFEHKAVSIQLPKPEHGGFPATLDVIFALSEQHQLEIETITSVTEMKK